MTGPSVTSGPDPASLAATASTLRQAALALLDADEALRASYAGLAHSWSGPQSVRHRRSGGELATACAELSRQLTAVSRALSEVAAAERSPATTPHRAQVSLADTLRGAEAAVSGIYRLQRRV